MDGELIEELIDKELEEANILYGKQHYNESQRRAEQLIKKLQWAFYSSLRHTKLPTALNIVIYSLASKVPSNHKDHEDAQLHFERLKAEFHNSEIYRSTKKDKQIRKFLRSVPVFSPDPDLSCCRPPRLSRTSQKDTTAETTLSGRVLKSLCPAAPGSLIVSNYALLQPIDHETFIYDIEDNEENYYLKQGLVRNVHYAVEGEDRQIAFPIPRNRLDTDEDVMLVQTHVYGIKDWKMTIQAAGRQNVGRLYERIQRYMNTKNFRLWMFCRMSVSESFLSSLSSISTLTYFHGGRLLSPRELVSNLELDSGSNALFVERESRIGLDRTDRQTGSMLEFGCDFYLTDDQAAYLNKCSYCLKNSKPNICCSRCGKDLFCSAECHSSGIQFHRQLCTSKKLFCFCIEKKNAWVRPFTGIKNTASTCYAAACVQGLCSFTQLATEWLQTAVAEALNSDNQSLVNVNVALRLTDLFSAIRAPGSAASIKPLFSAMSQSNLIERGLQDAHEFLLALINKVHEELKKPPMGPVDKECEKRSWENFITSNESVISKSIFGLLETTTTCKYCRHESKSYQEFSILSLSLSETREVRKLQVRLFPLNSPPKSISLSADYSMTVIEVKNELSRCACRDPLLIAFQLGCELQFLPDDRSLREYIQSEVELFAYAVPPSAISSAHTVTVIHQYTDKGYMRFPRVLVMLMTETLADLHDKVSQCFAHSSRQQSENGSGCGYSIVVCAEGVVGCIHTDKRKMKCPHAMTGRKEMELPYSDTRVFTFTKEKNMQDRLQLAIVWKKNQAKVRNDTADPRDIIITQPLSSDISLEKCLEKFTQIEDLDAGNQWTCEKCSKSASPQIKTSFLHCPRFLIIHIKRFASVHSITRKISDYVEFPSTGLPMKQQNGDTGIYRLCAVVVHKGGGLESGHYYAICRRGEEWVKLDDARVEVKDWSWVEREEAYLLFYERVRTELAQDHS